MANMTGTTDSFN